MQTHDETTDSHPRAEPFSDPSGFPEETPEAGAVRVHELGRLHLDVRAGADEEEKRDQEGRRAGSFLPIGITPTTRHDTTHHAR